MAVAVIRRIAVTSSHVRPDYQQQDDGFHPPSADPVANTPRTETDAMPIIEAHAVQFIAPRYLCCVPCV